MIMTCDCFLAPHVLGLRTLVIYFYREIERSYATVYCVSVRPSVRPWRLGTVITQVGILEK